MHNFWRIFCRILPHPVSFCLARAGGVGAIKNFPEIFLDRVRLLSAKYLYSKNVHENGTDVHRKRCDSQKREIGAFQSGKIRIGEKSMNKPFLKREHGILFGLFLLFPMGGVGQFVWSGAGVDDSWGTGENWEGVVAPSVEYNGSIVFTNAGWDTPNRIETDRRIYGTAQHAEFGLHYVIDSVDSATGAPAAHTTDLANATLVLDGGQLLVGINRSNSAARILGGTLQVGDSARTDIRVGVNTEKLFLPGISRLQIEGVLNAYNLGNLDMGLHLPGNGDGKDGGVVDFRQAAILSPEGTNTLTVNGNLAVAAGSGGPNTPSGTVTGRLYLPSTLESLHVKGDFLLGRERRRKGLLDFGGNSALTNFTVEGNFTVSSDGNGIITNLPSGVSVTVGKPGVPKSMVVGWHRYDSKGGSEAELILENGRFTAWLDSLTIGLQFHGNPYYCRGLFDIRSSEVQIGGTPNRIEIPWVSIGSRGLAEDGNATAWGELRLPEAVTNLHFGTLFLGHAYHASGRIDIGAGAQLQTLTVTDALYWGGGDDARIGYRNGEEFVEYFPAGMLFQVGLPESPATMDVSWKNAHYSRPDSGEGILRFTNGVFAAYLSRLRVGLNTAVKQTQPSTGILDLRGSELERFEVTGDAHIGNWEQDYCIGEVHLPAGSATIDGTLWIGDSNTTSRGLLTLDGTGLLLGHALRIQPSGLVTSHVYAVSAGFDLDFEDSANFDIQPEGRLHIVFHETLDDSPLGLRGLRMQGDQREWFQELANDGRLSWEAPNFSSVELRRLGILYDARRDETRVGLRPPRGMLLLFR